MKNLSIILLSNITTFVKLILYSSTCSIQLTCHSFIFFIHGFQSSILHKFKNTLNCWLKLNKDNNWSFLVTYTISIPASTHNYLIYKSKQYKSCNLEFVKHKLQKVLNIVKCTECSRNLEFQKRTEQNFITQNLCHRKEYRILKKKKLLQQCPKEVIYEYILAFVGWWSTFWEMVDSSGYILAGDGWWIHFGSWLVVVDIFWPLVSGGGWWWVVA